MTRCSQEGLLAQAAGQDLNYIAVAGALDSTGRAVAPPTVPLSLIGDYTGGALYLELCVLAAILEARQSGHGQVVDAAIVDGTASLLTSFQGMYGAGMVTGPRGTNAADAL